MLIGYSTHQAKIALDKDNLVAIPTETVYGLAANALHTKAIAKVFSAKNRPTFDPLIVHIKHFNELTKYANASPKILKLAKHFWPGPLTILADKKSIIPELVTAGHGKVALRVPNHSLTLELLNLLDYPLVAPSANPFGYVSPTTAAHVFANLREKVDYILDGGDALIGLESTIVSEQNNQIVIHRLGGLSIAEISDFLKETPVLKIQNNSNPEAPGMLDKHYSPTCKLNLYHPGVRPKRSDALIWFGQGIPFGFKNVFNLSANSNLDESAANLFSYLRKLDELNFAVAYICKLPDVGIGMAINDRISRALAD